MEFNKFHDDLYYTLELEENSVIDLDNMKLIMDLTFKFWFPIYVEFK